MRFLANDCETGGIGHDKSLLTAYFVALDTKFNPIDDLYLRMKPVDGIYKVQAEALAINGINLIEHDKIAETPDICMQKLIAFVEMHSDKGKDRLVPIGHNVAFDIQFYKHAILRRPTQMDKYVDYRCLDTCVIAKFLQLTGKLPPNMKISLDELAKFFRIPKPEVHDAKTDTLVSVDVLKRFIELITPTLTPQDLTSILEMSPKST